MVCLRRKWQERHIVGNLLQCFSFCSRWLWVENCGRLHCISFCVAFLSFLFDYSQTSGSREGVPGWTNADSFVTISTETRGGDECPHNKWTALIWAPLSQILHLSPSACLFLSLSDSLFVSLPIPLSPTLSPLLTSPLFSKRWNQFFSPRRRQITPNNPSFPEEGLFLSRAAKRPEP